MKNKIKELKNEEWEKVKLPSAHSSKHYFISNKARIKSVDKKTKEERLINPNKDRVGFLRVTIRGKNQKNHALYIHKLVGEHFVERPSRNHKYLIHKNLKREDNKLSNLKWVDSQGHNTYVKRRYDLIGYVPGPRTGKPKLTAKEVAQIKAHLAKGKVRKKKIADHFGVSHTQINRIEKGENWRNVDPAKRVTKI